MADFVEVDLVGLVGGLSGNNTGYIRRCSLFYLLWPCACNMLLFVALCLLHSSFCGILPVVATEEKPLNPPKKAHPFLHATRCSAKYEIAYEFLPFLRVYKDGHVERLLGADSVPATTDPVTGVSSKDLTIIPETNVSARLYLPNITTTTKGKVIKKLPVLLYFHGGGFLVSSSSSPSYHNYLYKLVAEAQIVVVSVDFRRPPEHPLPAAYEDSWAALLWVASHRDCDGPEDWLNNYADFNRFFVAGETSGANIAHNLAMMAGGCGSRLHVEILGLALVHPSFWGSDPVGSEGLDPEWKAKMDGFWQMVFPSALENNDPRVNPVAEGAPSLAGLGCRMVLVCLAEKDLLRDRAWLYYEALGRSGWTGVVEIHETEGEDHAFHLYKESEKAKDLIKLLATFYNKDMFPLL
ncbi:probable carboxylesterase 2 [Cornus florida]|uniref:probable carboxylesterase 2 n=1 Tax=Cornus florida TaxID=4283 RepID=UPI00289E6C9F|nr:probable carboxylesterase 2 [Cornus florida]